MPKKSMTLRRPRVGVVELATMRLMRVLFPELVRWAFESVDVRRRVRRLPRRQQQAVRLGAVAAVGLTTAGLVARRAIHGPDAPPPSS